MGLLKGWIKFRWNIWHERRVGLPALDRAHDLREKDSDFFTRMVEEARPGRHHRKAN